MDPHTLWLLVLSLATPIAGVVGFAVQLRQVRKTRLENEKLQLEIAALKAASSARDQRIKQVTTEEVLRYTGRDGVRFSRVRTPRPELPAQPTTVLSRLRDRALTAAFLLVVALVIGYAVYDVFRAIRWLASAL